jgi:hypothetical protein
MRQAEAISRKYQMSNGSFLNQSQPNKKTSTPRVIENKESALLKVNLRKNKKDLKLAD